MGIFTEQDQELIANAISEAEKATSGEIRIAVEKNAPAMLLKERPAISRN